MNHSTSSIKINKKNTFQNEGILDILGKIANKSSKQNESNLDVKYINQSKTSKLIKLAEKLSFSMKIPNDNSNTSNKSDLYVFAMEGLDYIYTETGNFKKKVNIDFIMVILNILCKKRNLDELNIFKYKLQAKLISIKNKLEEMIYDDEIYFINISKINSLNDKIKLILFYHFSDSNTNLLTNEKTPNNSFYLSQKRHRNNSKLRDYNNDSAFFEEDETETLPSNSPMQYEIEERPNLNSFKSLTHLKPIKSILKTSVTNNSKPKPNIKWETQENLEKSKLFNFFDEPSAPEISEKEYSLIQLLLHFKKQIMDSTKLNNCDSVLDNNNIDKRLNILPLTTENVITENIYNENLNYYYLTNPTNIKIFCSSTEPDTTSNDFHESISLY